VTRQPFAADDVVAGEWDGLVVICGASAWENIAAASSEMAKRIAPSTPVLFVDPPESHISMRRPGAAPSTVGPRLRLIGERLARLTPIVQPGIDRPALAALTDLVIRRAMRRAVRHLAADVEVVIVDGHHALFGACGERRAVVYATDDFVAGADLLGVRRDVLLRRRQRQARDADLAVCITDDLAKTWQSLGLETVVIPNGCVPELYADVDEAPLADDVDLEPPIAGFIGHISERIDVALLEAVAATGHSLLLVGPRPATPGAHRLDALLALPNVQWVSERPRAAMPSYLRWIDVGLTPYADTPFNRASFPLKTLDYLAAGRAVVATGLPATRWLDTDLVTIADEPAAFADAVVAATQAPLTVEKVASRRAFAARHSWEQRCIDLKQHLGLS
jgi:teichuronic acid biosynthesis glycosyltransferase TuaH